LWYIYKQITVFTGLIITLGSVLYIGLEVLNQLEIVENQREDPFPQSILFSTFNGIFVIFSLISFFLIFFGKIRFKEHNFETQNERLTKLANVDPLTELLNRRSINQKLELAMQRKMNLDIDFTVAIGDIDDFKKLNDEYGHSCGDEFLKNLAESIRAAVRDTDYVCRWGGEEVLILFTGSGQEASGRVLERIMKRYRRKHFRI
jgi:diguanylate cyclase (GGDEF)-like protein